MKGASDSTTFTAYTDSVSTASAAFGANNCGVPTYEIKMSDGTTAVPGYLTLSGTTLTATTTDPTHIGVHNIQLQVKLATYSITHTESFTVTITECVPSITVPTLTNQPYAIDQTSHPYTHAAFTDANACGYTFTYTAFLVGASETALPTNYVSYTAGTLTFAIYSSDIADVGAHTIKVYGTLDNTPTTANSGTFTITIANDCQHDAVSLTTAIGAQTYNIATPATSSTYQATFT